MPQKTVIRAQFDGRAQNWRIVKKTYAGCGGWRKFGSPVGYLTRQDCQNKIDKLIDDFPDEYQQG